MFNLTSYMEVNLENVKIGVMYRSELLMASNQDGWVQVRLGFKVKWHENALWLISVLYILNK